MRSIRAGRLSVAAVVAAVVLVDQLAKAIVTSREMANVVPARNPDLALGVLTGPPALLIAGMLLVLAVFLAVIGRWAVQVGISPLIPALIAGGCLGNALDRVRFGAVRDFLATPVAIINLADVAVIAGIVALAIALALRLRDLRAESCTIALEPRTLRATVVPLPEHRAA